MLQQTQAATVIDYYHRFLDRFPNVAILAAADEQEVLSYWSGLGYYRRARQLHAAAQQILIRFDGKIPADVEQLRSLPGIGRYTAGAIVSFAHGLPAPIVEANTQRLYCRLLGMDEDPRTAKAQAKLWQFAADLMEGAGVEVGLINQATMEVGSQVCLPKQPCCERCPIANWCVAQRENLQADIPRPAKRTAFTPLVHAAVVVYRGEEVLLRQNPAGQWWHGLWDFPRVDLTAILAPEERKPGEVPKPSQLAVVAAAMQQQLGLKVKVSQYLTTIRHGVTRYRIQLDCFQAAGLQRRLPAGHHWQWCALRGDAVPPLTSTAQKLARLLLSASPRSVS